MEIIASSLSERGVEHLPSKIWGIWRKNMKTVIIVRNFKEKYDG